MYNREYIKYVKFIEKNFPKNNIIKSIKLSNIHKMIYKNILFIDFIAKNETNKNDQRNIFFQDFLNINLRILYHLPLKDTYLNRVLSRTLSECVAKIMLTYFSNKADIQSMTMKNIKEELRKKGVNVRYKSLYEFISSNFGVLSADVHGRHLSTKYNNTYLDEMLNSEYDNFISELETFHNKLNEHLLPCLLQETSYDKSTANVATLTSILEDM